MTPDSFVRKLLTWQPEDICRRVSNSAGKNGSSAKKCRGRSARLPGLLSKASRLPPLQSYMESICFVLLYSCLFLSCLVGFSLKQALAIELRLASNCPSVCLFPLPPKGKNCGHVPLSPGHPGNVGCVYHCVS